MIEAALLCAGIGILLHGAAKFVDAVIQYSFYKDTTK